MKRTVLLSSLVSGVSLMVLSGAAQAMPLFSAGEHNRPLSAFVVSADSHGDEVAIGAEKFVLKLTDEGIGFLSNGQLSPDVQKEKFRTLLTKNFDMKTIARFSLGRYWRDATDAQRDEYMTLFKTMIVDVYSSRFSEYQGQTVEIVGSREEGAKDILVHSVLKQSSGPDVKVDWRVRSRNGDYKVIDVIVEGVSMAMTQRSDFSSVVQRGGGDIEALLVHLRQN
ncbi:MAG: ABC transporter substrate-binding protein [Rhodospirillales bacterium]|nr:ABC transporter substrate-binding protein [Rhodospirillales bacterium]